MLLLHATSSEILANRTSLKCQTLLFNYKTTACKTFNEDMVRFFFCNLTSCFHFWNKCLEKPHVRLFYYELSVCRGTVLQHPGKVSTAALVTPAAISCSPVTAVQSHSREEGQCSSQEGKSRRSGQDQAQGQANPSLEEISHSSFPCSLVPGYRAGPEHGHQTPWSRVEGCVGAQTPLTL